MSRTMMEALRDMETEAGSRGFIAIIPGEPGRHDMRTNLRVEVAYKLLRLVLAGLERTHNVGRKRKKPTNWDTAASFKAGDAITMSKEDFDKIVARGAPRPPSSTGKAKAAGRKAPPKRSRKAR